MKHITYFNKKRTQGGYTIVEILVYLGVLVLIAGALITTYLSLDTVLLRNKTERALAQSASVSLERIVRDIRSADSVNTGMSTFGSSPGTLALSIGGDVTRFYVASGALMVEVDGTETGALTSDDVTIQNLTFTRYTGTTTEMVRVALTLSANSKASSSTRTFYTSAVLRGSYE